MSIFPVELPGTSNVLLWAEPHMIEPAALNQIRDIATMPTVTGIRIMPDVHPGKGAVVGSVIAMKDSVSPATVGTDIGCGMMAVKTTLTLTDLPDDLKNLRLTLESRIPVGQAAHPNPLNTGKLKPLPGILGPRELTGIRTLLKNYQSLHAPVEKQQKLALTQAGTLGGGNHFVEVCADQDENIWLTLHSGSRGIGKLIANHHIMEAKHQSVKQNNRTLDILVGGTNEMKNYLHDLKWAQEYAAYSRTIMMHAAILTLTGLIPKPFQTVQTINCHHNYVAEETIDNETLIVTRKGAIRAGIGDYGIIPGSMGTGAYIIKGLGNDQSYQSASHGAGRKISRGKAKELFTLEDAATQTSGVECRKDWGIIDELPGAYKNLDQVIADQNELIEVAAKLETLLCIKG